jgi:hypothetical protein
MANGPFQAVPGGMEAFDAAHTAASAMIDAAGTANLSTVSETLATAIGPIGAAPYTPAATMAAGSNMAGSMLLSAVHAMTGAATEIAKGGFIQTDTV